MGVFDLLGQAGAGYTRGLATSEQLKFQQKDKEKQQKEAQGYRQEQLKLALRKQQFEENQAAGKEVEALRQLAFKSLLDAKQSRIDNPDRWAGMSPDAKLYAEEHLAHLEAQVGNKAATKEDFLRSFSMFPEKYGPLLRGQQGPSGAQGTEQPPANTPAPSSPSTPTQLTPNMVNPLERMGAVPQFFQQPNQDRSMAQQPDMPTPLQQTPQVAPDFIPQAAPPPGPDLSQFSPEYLAAIDAKKAAALASAANARRSNAAAAKDEAGQPYVGPQARADLANKGADTGLKNEQRRVLGGRLELDRRKADDFNKHWDDTYKASRTDANRNFQLHTRLADISQYAAETRDALAQVEMGLMQIRGTELRQKIADMEKLDPYFRGLIQALPAMVQTDLYGDKAISPEAAGMLRQALEVAGSKYAQVLGQFGGNGAAPSLQPGALPSFVPQQGFAPPTQQGGVPMLVNPQTGTMTPPGTEALPQMVIPHGVSLQGKGPAWAQSAEQNGVAGRQDIINAKPAPRKGKPNTRSKPAAKKQAGYVSRNPDKPTHMLAPKTQEMTMAQKKARLEELRRKAKQ